MGTGYSRGGASLSERGHVHSHTPSDPLQRLMETAPHQDTAEPPDELYGEMWELAAEVCTGDEMAVLQMLYGAMLSQREAGMYLSYEKGRPTPYSKTWVRKLRNRAFGKIRDAVINECFDETNDDWSDWNE